MPHPITDRDPGEDGLTAAHPPLALPALDLPSREARRRLRGSRPGATLTRAALPVLATPALAVAPPGDPPWEC